MADDLPDPEWAAAVDYMLGLIEATGPVRSRQAAREIAMRFGVTSDMVDAALSKIGLSGSSVTTSSASGWFGAPAAALQGRASLGAGGVALPPMGLHGEGTVTAPAAKAAEIADVGAGTDELRVDVIENVESLLDCARRHGSELLTQDDAYKLALFLLLVILLLVLTPHEQQWIEDKATLGGIAWTLASMMVLRNRRK